MQAFFAYGWHYGFWFLGKSFTAPILPSGLRGHIGLPHVCSDVGGQMQPIGAGGIGGHARNWFGIDGHM